MADKKVYTKFVTGLGAARYPKLIEQDVYKGKEVGYKCGIILDDKMLAVVRKTITAALKASGMKTTLKDDGMQSNGKNTPLHQDKDGTFYFEAKSYKKTPLFRADGKDKFPEGTKLGSGSTIRIDTVLTEGNDHLVAYMNGIQVAKLVEGGSDGFDAIEGYESDDDDTEGFDAVDPLDI